MSHTPVLLNEILDFANAENGELFIDGTAGDGGYIVEILKRNKSAKVLGIDLDQTSQDKLGHKLAAEGLSQRCTLVVANFRNIKHLAESHNFGNVSAIILDLGFSSSQLDDPTRGLSFQVDAALDMRFDQNQKKTAADIISSYTQQRLAQIFREYGEEKLSAKIATK